MGPLYSDNYIFQKTTHIQREAAVREVEGVVPFNFGSDIAGEGGRRLAN